MPNTSISFPTSPTAGQTHTYGSTTYTFDGSYWSVNGSSVDQVSTNDIQNGAVTPAKLSTGGPSWTSGGNLTITGDLTVDTNTLFVDASANRVGVKTTSPIANYGLTVLDNIYVGNGSDLSPSGTGLGHISINGDGYTGYLTLDNTDMHIGHNASSRGITFDTNETPRLTITTAGNVGIGTSTPSTALEVNGIIKNTNPAFHAIPSQAAPDVGTTPTLYTYWTDVTDIGSNMGTTYFVAPVTGVYCFSVFMMFSTTLTSPASSINYGYAQIRKYSAGNSYLAGSAVFHTSADSTVTYQSVSGTWVVPVTAGEKIAVIYVGKQYGISYDSFSGYLIG
jgi:hypothetical protein